MQNTVTLHITLLIIIEHFSALFQDKQALFHRDYEERLSQSLEIVQCSSG